MTVCDKHQIAIAKKTLSYNATAARVMGQTHAQAIIVLRRHYSDKQIKKMLSDYGHSRGEIDKYFAEANGGC